MEIANSQIINSLYFAHIMAIENNDFLNSEEKYVMETIFQKIKKDETLSFESKKSMFVLLDKAISDAQINENVLKLDKGLFSAQTDLQEKEYEQAITFFVAVKNEKNEGKEKINRIYLNFFSDSYKEFNVGDTSNERSFVVKAYEELGERFGYKEVLVQGTKVDLKLAGEELAEIYSDLGKEYKEHQQQRLEQEKVIELQKAHQLEKDKIAEQIVNKLEKINVLSKLGHINVKFIISENDLKNFFIQPEYNMTKEQANDFFAILSDSSVSNMVFHGIDGRLNKRSLNDLKEISDKLDKPLALIEENLGKIVTYKLALFEQKLFKQLLNKAEETYNLNANAEQVKITKLQNDIGSLKKDITDKEREKATKLKIIETERDSLSYSKNLADAKEINDSQSINNPSEAKISEKLKFNFPEKYILFREQDVDKLITDIHDNMKRESNAFHKQDNKTKMINTFIDDKKVGYGIPVNSDEVSVVIDKKEYLNKYVDKKWYRFLGPLAKWAVNKFSKHFKESFEKQISDNKKAAVDVSKVEYFAKYEQEVRRYIEAKLESSNHDREYDKVVNMFNEHSANINRLYEAMVATKNKIETLLDKFYLNENNSYQFEANEISKLKNDLSELYLSWVGLSNDAKRLPKELTIEEKKLKLPEELGAKKEQLSIDLDTLKTSLLNFKENSEKQLDRLTNIIEPANDIVKIDANISNMKEQLESKQGELKVFITQHSRSKQDIIQETARNDVDNDPDIKKAREISTNIVAYQNLSIIHNLANEHSNKQTVESSITPSPSSASIGDKA